MKSTVNHFLSISIFTSSLIKTAPRLLFEMARVNTPAALAAPTPPTTPPTPTIKRWRPIPGYQPPYMTPMPDARVGFNDLPMEVMMRIFTHVDRFYGLLLTCKRTCIPAGERLYANGPVCASNDPALWHRHPDRMRGGATLFQVMSGLEQGDGVTAQRPFGNTLKRRFMAHITSLRCHAVSETVETSDRYSSPSYNMTGELLELIDIFHELHLEQVEPFPALQEVVFTRGDDPKDHAVWITPYRVDWTRMVGQFAALCRPRSFEWTEQKVAVNNLDGLGYGDVWLRAGPNLDIDGELKFAGGHLPDVVQHTIRHVPSCSLDSQRVPFPCYGTYNIVYSEPLCVCYDTQYGCMGYIEKVLWEVHPEHKDGGEEVKLGPKEKALRDATTWEFAWSAPSMLDMYFSPMEMLEDMLEQVWDMMLDLKMVKYGRVMLSSPDIWRRRENWDMEEEWREWVDTGENIQYPGWEDYWEDRMSSDNAAKWGYGGWAVLPTETTG
ncbi:hypothetical protein IAT38_002643 [Cryptococcus sp. DSM 104549]